jgi:crotonobetainyl-CoA:carnitine CoA-transferase CaiB-like acyl-CoA transferase
MKSIAAIADPYFHDLFFPHGAGSGVMAGQVVDAALYEGAYSFMEPHVPAFEQLGVVAKRAGSRLPGNTPNSLYPTADGRYIVLAAASNPVFARLAAAIGKPELAADSRFSSSAARVRNEDACDREIEAWTSGRTVEEIETALREANVPSARIYTIEDIFADPHFRARDMLVEADDPRFGKVAMTGIVLKLSTTPGAVWRSGRGLGEDTREVLRDELGVAVEEIVKLEERGTVVAAKDQAEQETT